MRRQLLDLIKRFHRDERGVFLVIFGVVAIVVIALAGAVVDYVSIEQARTRAQVALDSAALALQGRIYDDTEEEIRAAAEGLVRERVGNDVALSVVEAVADTMLGTLYLRSSMTVQTTFVALVGINEISATVVSEATRGSTDIEVGVALDVTGSMNEYMFVPFDEDLGETDDDQDDIEQTKIEALRRALGRLIDSVVMEAQEPSYSKMALVPYSTGVNVGAYAAAVRGPITAGKAITSVSFLPATGVPITAATRADPVQITSEQSRPCHR